MRAPAAEAATAKTESWPTALEPPAALAASPLLRRGGFAVFPELLEGDFFRRLRADAFACYSEATLNQAPEADGEEWRGGCPERQYRSAAAGEIQDAFYHSRRWIDLLSAQVKVPVAPTGARGSYSYYCRHGDFLGLHRDVDACDLAVITCLYHGPDQRPDGGALTLYPERNGEPLSAIRRTPEEGAVQIRLLPGQTVVMLGGIVPHTLQPVGPREARIVSVLCYRALVC